MYIRACTAALHVHVAAIHRGLTKSTGKPFGHAGSARGPQVKPAGTIASAIRPDPAFHRHWCALASPHGTHLGGLYEVMVNDDCVVALVAVVEHRLRVARQKREPVRDSCEGGAE